MSGPLRDFSNFGGGEVKILIAMNNDTAIFASVIGPFRFWCHDLIKLVTLLTPCIKALRTKAIP